ncbi:ATP-binding protein [Paracoccus onubensis]|uniref:ATP-binding protein n=1 Tax=Paracoccus onubensis TaxID=1675788 RepID=UPI00272FE53E|nr:ATP-binding protein [Paracoccus onubensis]MDP0927924.1 ATP-binding protein [Paracoccus onubensis]
MNNNDVAKRMLALRAAFASNPTYASFQRQFQTLLERRRFEMDAGVVSEARGIALIGASGSGKTTAVNRLLRSSSDLVLGGIDDIRCDVVSFPVPSPATLKFVGQTALHSLGYPLRRDKTAYIIWDMVREHLHARRTLFLHLDEAQDLSLHQTPREMQSVINTLKSLMQNRSWPVGMILSGMPALKNMLNHDPQLARRFYPIEFPSLNAINDIEQVFSTISFYAAKADLTPAEDLLLPDFAARLIHAAAGEFGLTIELIIAAIERALLREASVLEPRDFREAFTLRSGCVDGLNPFVAEDFERIDSRKLLGGGI